MFALFLLLGILQLMILGNVRAWSKTFLTVILVLALALFIHHVTDVLDIRL